MEWVDQLYSAMTYLEANLEGEIDLEQAARLACCSVYHFQRMFPYLAGVPLSEYIRRRRMTRAADALLQGERVLDVALRYGYTSPTAFNRAFRSVHGCAPSEAGKPGVRLLAYPPVRFHISVKGDTEMEYQIVQKEAFRVVGPRIPISMQLEENFKEVPQFWGRTAADGTVAKLAGLMAGEPRGLIGLSDCAADRDGHYYIAVATDAPAPEGMYEFTVPAGTWAIFSGTGAMPDGIQQLEQRIVTEWLPSSGWEWARLPDLEVYLTPDPVNAKFEVWMPIVRAQKD